MSAHFRLSPVHLFFHPYPRICFLILETERGREGERGKERGRERGREREKVRDRDVREKHI